MALSTAGYGERSTMPRKGCQIHDVSEMRLHEHHRIGPASDGPPEAGDGRCPISLRPAIGHGVPRRLAGPHSERVQRVRSMVLKDAWQRFRERLIEPRDELPPSRHRFYIASNFLYLFGLFGHTAFIPVFALLGNRYVFLYNLICIGVDGLCFMLNQRGQAKSAFVLWVGAVAAHTALCTATYSWSSGFHYYILGLTAFVFTSPWSHWIKIALTMVLFGLYLQLYRHGQAALPWESLTPLASPWCNYLNILVNFVGLAYVSFYYTFAAEKAERALAESRRELDTTLAASPVGIALVQQRCIRWSNRAMGDMLGTTPAALKDQPISRFFQEATGQAPLEAHLYSGPEAPGLDLREVNLTRADGSRMVCHITSRALDPCDPSRGAIAAVVDLSALKAAQREKAELEAQVRRAEKMEAIGTLAGGVAHDLNNILSGILSYPDLLLFDLPPKSRLRGPILTIKKAGERAAAIVQDLLTLARRGLTASQETINLNTIVQEYLESPECRKLRDEHPMVTIDAEFDPELFNICATPVQVAKALMNLVTNAAEALPRGGTIRLCTDNRYLELPVKGYHHVEQGDYAVLTVSDTGEGIAAKDLERIFEPFFTRKHLGRSGSGLGLAVVWGMVRDCRGYIDVVSEQGRGTLFTLYFPASRHALTLPEGEMSSTPPAGGGQWILVVDDLPEQRAIAMAMLQRLGYAAESAASGEMALVKLDEAPWDLVLLDMIMGEGLDGLDTYRRMLALRPGQRAVIASGFAETERVREALRLGAATYLRKPYTLKRLAAAVKAALER
jgi:signal transduction histidine kinase